MISDFSTISGQTNFWIGFGDPIYFVDSTTTPMVTVTAALGGTGFRTGAASDSVSGGTGLAPIPTGAMPDSSSDHALAIVDRVAEKEWGFWNMVSAAGVWTAGEASTLDLSGSGVRPPEGSNPWWAGEGPRACGFSLIAGIITTDEIKAGAIEHALVVGYPLIRSSYYTPPASSAQPTMTGVTSTRGILCGGRIQLDPTLDVTKLGLKPGALAIARALQKYGAYIGDYSGAVSLYANSSPDSQAYWSTGALSSPDAQPIPLNRFRVLQIGTTYNNMN